MNHNIIFRRDKIVELCAGKTVLHLGFIQHSHLYEDLIKNKKWLHEQISKVAKRLVGIDYLEKDVEHIKKTYGYECYYGDVTKLDEVALNDKFEIIVCGELIEHLDNAGLMLNGIKKMMNSNSLLIITTPNPWSLQRLKLIKKGCLENEWLNKEHTCWYTYETLKQLLDRCGYCEERYDYYYCHEEKDLISHDPLLGKIRNIKRKLVLNNTKKNEFDGLFFVTKIKI